MLDSSRSSHGAAVGLALLVTFLWSTSWILIRLGLDDEQLAPLGFAAMRYGLAALVLLGWVVARRTERRGLRGLERRVLARVGALGLVLIAVTQGAQFVAIDQQPAATTSLVLSATPLLVAMLSFRALAEQPSRPQLAGGVLVVVGAALYFAGALGATVAGMIASVVGLIANTAGSVLGRGINRAGAVPAVTVTALSMATGAAVLGVASVAIEGLPTVTGRALAIIAWLAIVNTALAFTWWNLSLQKLSAVESAGVNNTMLVQIAVLAWVFLDEPLGWDGTAGVGLVSAGVFLTQARSGSKGAEDVDGNRRRDGGRWWRQQARLGSEPSG